jgi:hypothetical protein
MKESGKNNLALKSNKHLRELIKTEVIDTTCPKDRIIK